MGNHTIISRRGFRALFELDWRLKKKRATLFRRDDERNRGTRRDATLPKPVIDSLLKKQRYETEVTLRWGFKARFEQLK